MKRGISILMLLLCNLIISQKNSVYTFGKITMKDNNLTVYDKDTTANAVILFENGETEFKVKRGRIVISTKYYKKVKIFKKEGFEKATVDIPIYNSKDRSEKVLKVKGFTHNSSQRSALNPKNVFTEKSTENWSIVKFTMPNIKEQSIIEYEYTLESPFLFNFTGWNFQSDIPTIYSRFYAIIPGNYLYNRSLKGFVKLSENNADIRKSCFSVPGNSGVADCEVLTYAMRNVPAFIEEDYMTTKKNYLSSMKFELSEFRGFDGSIKNFTKKWKDVDKEFRSDQNIGRQLKKRDYIEKQLPEDLFNINDELSKGKKIYDFIKNHFVWNGKIKLFKDVNVKKAFNEKVGNSSEINIALINALNAVGLNAKIVLLSTRNNGLPTKLYPVISDFNYAIVKVTLNEKIYLLDATDKFLPFGILPFRALNESGRVMDFKEGSYWIDINPNENNQTRITMDLKINDEGNFEGVMNKTYNGYRAKEKREKITTLSEDKYLTDIEDVDDNLVINSYENTNKNDLDQPLKELFEIIIDGENDLNQDVIILNPFINSKILNNPFQLNERTYPIDFGYPRFFQYILLLKIPENYKISSLPDNVGFKLPKEGGYYELNIKEINNKITMIFKYEISRTFFYPNEYEYLKEFFNQIIKTQNSLITLEKI